MTDCYKKPCCLMAIGLFLTLSLWFGTLPVLGGFLIQSPTKPNDTTIVTMPYFRNSTPDSARFTIQASLRILPFQSSIIRIVPDDCINALRINDVSIAPGLSPSLPVCFKDVLTVDLSPYLSAGTNKIILEFTDQYAGRYGADIRAVHSTPAMCLIALSLGLFLYGVLLICRKQSGIGKINYRRGLIVIGLLLFAAGGRGYFVDFESSDFYYFLTHWLQHIQRYRLGSAYGANFSDYSPLYTYLIGISDLFFPVHGLYTLKFLTFVGDIAMAALIYRIIKNHGPGGSVSPMVGAAIFLAIPTAIVNGASAAQCDIFYTLFLVATMYGLFLNRIVPALLCYGIAISFKFQAIFLSPFLLIFIFRKALPWRLLWIPVAVYMASILPCWLEGRDMKSLLLVYLYHFNNRPDLGVAGNFYYLLYQYFSDDVAIISYIGIAVTSLIAAMFSYMTYCFWDDRKTLLEYVLLSTFCVSLMIFFLPKMLDRYFFPAEIFAVLLACLRPRWSMIAVLFQVATLLVFWRSNLPALPYDLPFETAHAIALGLNVIAILCLGKLCYRHIWRINPARLD